ncbi:hypothetical protein [Brevibacterium salitolerans]|uniref:Uncharacterized protein n=1 Tax=Brevibacterium salitolerans TaxID=1403566 RepID=A0ABP5I7Z7_9MICO
MSAEEIRRKVGAEFTDEEIEELRGGIEAAEEQDDRQLLAALIATGAFARRLGDPVMRDELSPERRTAASPPPADVDRVIRRVRDRGFPGAVRRETNQEGTE